MATLKSMPTTSVQTAISSMATVEAKFPIIPRDNSNQFTKVDADETQVKMQRVGLERELCETQLIRRSDVTSVWNKNEKSPLSERITYTPLSKKGYQVTVSSSFNAFEETGTSPYQVYNSDPITVGLFFKTSDGALVTESDIIKGISRVLPMILDFNSDGTMATSQTTLARLMSGIIKPVDLD